MDVFLSLIVASFVAASISFTVSVSGLFESMREWIYKNNTFLGKLITCPWCFGHYVVFFMLAIAPGIPHLQATGNYYVDFFFTSFAIIGMMGFWHKTLILGYEPVHKMMAQRQINKLKEEKLIAETEKLKSEA